MSELPQYKFDRTFDAPRDMVWKVWTDPEYLARWYGPGVETTIHKFDLKPGGMWLNEMKWGENSHYQKVVFKTVDKPTLLIWDHFSSVDAQWDVAPNPMMPNWPALLLTTVKFEENGDQTNVCLTQIPKDASDEEIAGFAKAMAGMDNGWGGGYKIIDEILAELKS